MPDLKNHLFDRAYELFSVHQYEAAEEELLRVLKATPDDPWALALLALCQSCRSDFAAAYANAKTAIELASNLAFTHYAMASILEDQELFDEALISIRQAIRLDPDDPLYYAQLAMIHYQQQRWAEALQATERGLALREDDADCQRIREQILSADDFETSQATRDPLEQRMVLEIITGKRVLERGEQIKALLHFRQALAIKPDNQDAWQGVLNCLEKQTPIRSRAIRFFMHLGELRLWLRTTVICAALICWPLAQHWLPEKPGLVWGLVAVTVGVYMLWMAAPIRNALLLTIPAARKILPRRHRRQAKWFCLSLVMMLGWSITWIIRPWPTAALMVVITALLSVPVSRIFDFEEGWARLAMSLYSAIIGLLALATFGLFVYQISPIDQVVMFLMMLAVVLSGALSRYLNRSKTRHHRQAPDRTEAK